MLLGIVVGHDEAASCSSMDHGGGKRRDDVHYCLFLAAASGADLTSAHGSEFFRVRTPFNRRFVGTPPRSVAWAISGAHAIHPVPAMPTAPAQQRPAGPGRLEPSFTSEDCRQIPRRMVPQ